MPSSWRNVWLSTSRRSFSASTLAGAPSVWGRMTTNSSPPYRAGMSVSRTAARIRKPTSRSVRLPRRCPYWSLIGLKRSRSMKRSESTEP